MLLETEWVLRHGYGFARDLVSDALNGIVNLENAVVQDPGAVRTSLGWHRSGMDFADALHRASADKADELITFDRSFAAASARLGEGVAVRALG